MEKNSGRHKNTWQPMRRESMHPGALFCFFCFPFWSWTFWIFGVPKLFPSSSHFVPHSSSQNVPQVLILFLQHIAPRVPYALPNVVLLEHMNLDQFNALFLCMF